jgi:(1->4)-alpha-D-glucan 1-alpha-D-glucosylmutase
MIADPLATYRLQLNRGFTFDDAADIVPYLARLGVSHVYASPITTARPGSMHGYDVTDYAALNPELGGEPGFDRLVAALRAHDLGLIVDFVPNHMSVGFSGNRWWLDVLEWGPDSPFASFFDVDWGGLPFRPRPGVLLPILGGSYRQALMEGQLALRYETSAGAFAVWNDAHKLPIDPRRSSTILETIVAAAGAARSEAGAALLALAAETRGPDAPNYDEAPAFKRRLASIDGAAAIIDAGLRAYDATKPDGMRRLHRLLERQHYHLADWRTAFSDINYRRFFDISELAGVRPEFPPAFELMHELIFRLIGEGKVQGLRLDHIDGLSDPAAYCSKLTRRIAELRGPDAPRFFLVVEKILADGESLPPLDGVLGATGYERMALFTRVLADESGLATLDRVWRSVSGVQGCFAAVVLDAKRLVLDTMLSSEFEALAHALLRIAAGGLATRDLMLHRLRRALAAYVLSFPVYRTYVAAGRVGDADARLIDATIAQAKELMSPFDADVLAFLHDVLSMKNLAQRGLSRKRIGRFVARLQQFIGPLTAKALEDTGFYRHHRLLAFNEVGGDPGAPALAPAAFHARQQAFAAASPLGLSATATHDTKRGEDARMRILALTELAGDWQKGVENWRAINRRNLRDRLGAEISGAHELMLYQALAGAWPLEGLDENFAERMTAYAIKAAREGKQQTSWSLPDEAYESRLSRFVRALLDPAASGAFLDNFAPLARRAALIGALKSLSQLTLKALAPGTPDFYQGCELWDLSFVDPDNRRPVDYAHRRSLLDKSEDWGDLARNWRDGRIKFALTRRLLQARAAFPDIFAGGDYQPVDLPGADDGFIAFSRGSPGRRVVCVAARLFARATGGGERWPHDFPGVFAAFDGHDLLRGGAPVQAGVPLAHLLRDLPVAVIAECAPEPA